MARGPTQRVRWALWCGAEGVVKERGGLYPEYFHPPPSQVRGQEVAGHCSTGSRNEWPKMSPSYVARFGDSMPSVDKLSAQGLLPNIRLANNTDAKDKVT